MNRGTMITTYNTALSDTASEILEEERGRKKPWITKDALDLCDKKRDLKKGDMKQKEQKRIGKLTRGFRRQ